MRKTQSPTLLCAFAALFSFAWQNSCAHPLSESQVIAVVKSNAITARFEIKVEDLTLFHPVSTNEMKRIPSSDLLRATERHVQFLKDYFVILDQYGSRLQPTLTGIATNTIPEPGVHVLDLPNDTITFDFSYAYELESEFLTFRQEYGGKESVVPSQVDLTLLKDGRPLGGSQKLKPGIPKTFQIQRVPNAPELRGLAALRARNARQHEANLGIPDQNGVHAFLYIEPHLTRFQLVAPLHIIESWDSSLIPTNQFINPETEIGRVFSPRIMKLWNTVDQSSRVRSNGRRRFIVSFSPYIVGPETRDLDRARPQSEELHRWQTRYAVDVEYDGWLSPTNVGFQWNLFSDEMPFLKLTVNDYLGGTKEHFLTPSHTNMVWSTTAADEPAEYLSAPPLKPLKFSLITFIGAVMGVLLFVTWLCGIGPERRTVMQLILVMIIGAPFARILEWHAPFVQERVTSEEALEVVRHILSNAESENTVLEIVEAKLVELEDTRDPREFMMQVKWRVDRKEAHWGHEHRSQSGQEGYIRVAPMQGKWYPARIQYNNWELLSRDIHVPRVESNVIGR